MIHCEPKIQVALLQNTPDARFFLQGSFSLPDGRTVSGEFFARAACGQILLADSADHEIMSGKGILLSPDNAAGTYFTIRHVVIGIDFHWQRVQEQSFRGALLLIAQSETTLNLINLIPLEEYLASVISSEMSADAPLEFLKAQAVTARSWLCAMLRKKEAPRHTQIRRDGEIAVWQDVNDHEGFDVCADDHCQRYQGITRIISENVQKAVEATRGEFLVSEDQICDARYHKCCGGRTDLFSTAWEKVDFPYLQSMADGEHACPPVFSETQAAKWLIDRPPAYCNTNDKALLVKILPAFDQETPDFYRWKVAYTRRELEDILKKKSGMDFGDLQNIVALERGPSGRIRKLKITGSKKTMVVGKELEIRRWLSDSHLYSSAFIVITEHEPDGSVRHFIFHGGGWGHGVGLCQIGAAVMAAIGFKAEKILSHYFTDAMIKKLY